MGLVDLRSDTVTRPSPAMRRAMAEAEVGDDVYREDPTVNRLEARVAEIFNRQAALFVPTGSMGNQVAVKVHTHHGQEVVCEEQCHVFNYEMAAMAAISGCLARTVRGGESGLSWDRIAPALRQASANRAGTGLISLENTLNINLRTLVGGTVTDPSVSDEVCREAHARKIPVHLDGARIFNAATALGRSVEEITQGFDSVMFCLSKGLGAPVGSLVVGGKDFIEEARRVRKILGGGMRQAGVLAAAGLVALEESPRLLHRDHENAKFLAEGLARIPGIHLDPEKVKTNILIFGFDVGFDMNVEQTASGTVKGAGARAGAEFDSFEISRRLAQQGVLANGLNPTAMRMVTHCDVDRAGCERALKVLEEILTENRAALAR